MIYGPEIYIMLGVIIGVCNMAGAYVVGYACGYFEMKHNKKRDKVEKYGSERNL